MNEKTRHRKNIQHIFMMMIGFLLLSLFFVNDNASYYRYNSIHHHRALASQTERGTSFQSILAFLRDRLRSILCRTCHETTASNNETTAPYDSTKMILDSISSVRNTSFNTTLYAVIQQCLNATYIPVLSSATATTITTNHTNTSVMTTMVPLVDVVNLLWLRLLQLATRVNETADPWGGLAIAGATPWLEWNPTYIQVNLTSNDKPPMSYRFPIMEPCNTVSNFAYYSSMIVINHYNRMIPYYGKNSGYHNNNEINPKIIENNSWRVVPLRYRIAYVNTFGLLAWGSAFFHGSETKLGRYCDNLPIGIISYTAYQMMIDNNNTVPYNPILNELITETNGTNQTQQRSIALDVLTQMNTILYEQPTEVWNALLKQNIDDRIPYYTLTFGGIVCIILNLIFPIDVAKQILVYLGQLLLSNNPEQVHYINDILASLFRQSITEEKLQKISYRDRIILLSRFAGTLTKLIWAFLWQEKVISGPQLQSRLLNFVAARITPVINGLTNMATGYDRYSYIYDQQFQNSYRVYPDNAHCDILQPHSKWHLISANGLVDLLLLCSDTKHLIDSGKLVTNTNARNRTDSNGNIIIDNVNNSNGDNANFFQCILKYGMSGFDVMDPMTNDQIQADPIRNITSNCFHHVLEYITNQTNMSYFYNCFISQLRLSSVSKSTTSALSSQTLLGSSHIDNIIIVNEATTTTKENTLDGCLLHNDCIVSTNTWTVNIQRLSNCTTSSTISINQDENAIIKTGLCQQYVTDPAQLEQCFYECDSHDNAMCINHCTLRYSTQLSSQYQQAASCLVLLSNPDSEDRASLSDKCFVSSSMPTSAFSALNGMVNGLSELTKCAYMGVCRSSYNGFRVASNSTYQCAKDCYYNGSRQQPFPFLTLPKGLSCWLSCYVWKK